MKIDCHNHLGVDLLFYLHGDYPYSQDLPTLTADGARHGVTHWIAFPMVSNLAFSPKAFFDGRLETAGALESVPYAFENRRMLDELYSLFPDEGKRVLPFAIVDPERNPNGQAGVLRDLRTARPFYGIKIQGTIIQSRVKALLDSGSVFLELAREWDIPFIIHSSYLKSDPWSQSHDILDIAEAHPEVRFCLAHSCRFERSALDRLAALPNCWFDCSAHCIHCDAAVQGLPIVPPETGRFPSDYSRPDKVLADLAGAYPEKLLWGSDSPFYSYVARHGEDVVSLRSTYAREAACLDPLPAETTDRITRANTLAFLGRDPRALGI